MIVFCMFPHCIYNNFGKNTRKRARPRTYSKLWSAYTRTDLDGPMIIMVKEDNLPPHWGSNPRTSVCEANDCQMVLVVPI